jgi:hypothetical protein
MHLSPRYNQTSSCDELLTTQTPASQGELLSAKSDDPNGTLITGLQNRDKPFTQVNPDLMFIYTRRVHSKSWPSLRTIAKTGDVLYIRNMGMDQAPGITFYDPY